MDFKTIMITVDNPLSKAYAAYVEESWNGFNLKYYDAVTPKTLDKYSDLEFGRRGRSNNPRELTDTEKACFYSQYNLWKKCATENTPILILEHDALCVNHKAIRFNPDLDVQFFGQHSMEAVMYNPRFAKLLVEYCKVRSVTGPMNTVDNLLGYFNIGQQSRYGRPHARYMGPKAPVVTVIDPNLGTTVDHKGTTLDRLTKDRDLFRIVNISKKYSELVTMYNTL